MSIPYASGKRSWGFCDRCNFRYRLRLLKTEMVAGRANNLLVCPTCWDADHPQNWQGRYPVFDPQALRNPRPDPSMAASRVIPGFGWGAGGWSGDTNGISTGWGDAAPIPIPPPDFVQ